MKVSLEWVTPEGDARIAYMARVSNPDAQRNDSPVKLVKYMLDHKHNSPFEMVCMCVEIETTRDISRQILRHRSFHFQEFSQRYAVTENVHEFAEARLQDIKNRQNSIICDDPFLIGFWEGLQQSTWDQDYRSYRLALDKGIAKEVARKLLPEGLTPTKMYMQGTVRDWLYYIQVRTGPETQLEHRKVALECKKLLGNYFPITFSAAEQAGII